MTEIIIRDPVRIPTNKIHPNSWNPNEQSDTTFNALVQEIEEDGFDHPLNVVPCNCDLIEGEHYIIIGGAHRHKFAVIKNMPEIPCVVNTEWDEVKQKLKTVRRNLISGHLDARKFTDLVRNLEGKIDISQMPALFGFDNEKEFQKNLIKESEKRDKSFIDSLMESTKREKHVTDALTDIVGTLFRETSSTIDQSYLAFTYKGRTHIALLMDESLYVTMQRAVDHIKTTGGNLSNFLNNAISDELDR